MSLQTQQEMLALTRRAVRVANVLEECLQAEGRTARFLGVQNKQRLVILESWAQRYRVSLRWVISTLLRAYKRTERQRRGQRWGKRGLPVTIATLVSAGARELLVEMLREEQPGEENYYLSQQMAQERIITERLAEVEAGQSGERFNLTDFESVAAYVAAYRKRATQVRRAEQSIRREARKTGRPYRGSPWK